MTFQTDVRKFAISRSLLQYDNVLKLTSFVIQKYFSTTFCDLSFGCRTQKIYGTFSSYGGSIVLIPWYCRLGKTEFRKNLYMSLSKCSVSSIRHPFRRLKENVLFF